MSHMLYFFKEKIPYVVVFMYMLNEGDFGAEVF